MTFSLLGPLAVRAGGLPVPLGPHKQRLLLAQLLCRANTPVPVDLLTEALWQNDPPRTARKNLQVYASALRTLLGRGPGPERLALHPGGYLLRIASGELDTHRLDALARAGREAAAEGGFASAAALLGQALELWQGESLPDLRCSQPLQAEAERLDLRCLGIYEDWAEAALETGQAQAVLHGIDDLVEQHPLRERLQAARMRALHRTGRRTEALAAYDGLRQLLSRELGLAPSPPLEQLYRSILADGSGAPDARPDPGRPSASGAAAGRGGRTLLPADTVDFTGRQAQLARLTDALRRAEGRTVVLVGPTGTGKTTLAVHAAHRMRADFPDGRLLVRLRAEDGTPRCWTSVLGDLLRLTGLAGSVPDDPDAAAAAWRGWLADRKMLLVLDDAPDESAARALLPGTGAGAALVTSRSQLAGLSAAHRSEVRPYAPAEALELLERIIGSERVRADREAAERIVAASGLLPLGVRVSGMRLSVLRHLPLAEYADRLAGSAGLLDELAAGDVAVRPRLAVGWRELPADGRAALLRLARLPLARPFTLHEAAAVLGRGRTPPCGSWSR
ncbi:BTAD domain-containing putative transcriptional regulator [Streptacidiphilus sp. PB12-B1b]|uniref:BTAD domain-containing putative transcriptional regulator n=1 Tax=Streptacidiphilus sp. PB12-B1b TaxID=2705012 RepID=UPI001CDC9F17|nr:BTAD domain-containing putative transcriptional regulator [Streptacidiphilus sp. PB12-B1b]